METDDFDRSSGKKRPQGAKMFFAALCRNARCLFD
jgi:hypothetical protein